MKQIFYAAIAAMVVANVGCSKEDDNGRRGAGFDFEQPNNLRQTSKIQVTFDVACDAMPTVRFRPDAGALGVVSLTPETQFGVDYVYAAEPIAVNYSAGRATATFWYIPLTGGNHTVTFMVEYTQGGEAQTGTNTQTFKVKDDWFGNFYPEVRNAQGYYYFYFRNEIDKLKKGCNIYLMFRDVNGEKDLNVLGNISLSRVGNILPDTFYPIKCELWDARWNDWMDGDNMAIDNEQIDPFVMHLTFCDDFNRCRDVEVKMDENRNLISSTYGDYYLWPKNN